MKESGSTITEDKFLSDLRENVAFLKEIPDDIYFKLDPSELYLPDDDIAKLRSELETRLGHYIMTYNADVFNLTIPIERHLCANLKEVVLTGEQLKILQDYERRVKEKGVTFVAYQKPLKLISPEQSQLFAFYKERGLV